jgi:hypothetical protein
MVQPLPISQLYRSGWPLLLLDAVPVRVKDQCGWWGERFWQRFGGRNDGESIIRREEGVLIAVIIAVDNGKIPVVGSTRAMPTFEDSGASLVVGLDVMLGEDDSEVGVTEGGNTN